MIENIRLPQKTGYASPEPLISTYSASQEPTKWAYRYPSSGHPLTMAMMKSDVGSTIIMILFLKPCDDGEQVSR